MYSKKVIELFKNPKHLGKIKNPDGVGKVGNPACGDLMEVSFIVKDDLIKDIKIQTFGCVAAITTASTIAQLAKGKTIEYARKITHQQIIDALDGLPAVKRHCSHLAIDALKKAIENYQASKKFHP